jgi:ferritin heavy chain
MSKGANLKAALEETNSFVFNTSESSCRQNFPKEIEDALNEQVTKELTASHTYLAMSSFFAKDGINLSGFRHFFKKESDDERNHANSIIDYILLRGGEVKIGQIPSVDNNWKSVVEVIERSLSLEKEVNGALLRISNLAADKKDVQTADFMSKLTTDQSSSLREYSDILTNLKKLGGDGKGLYRYDRALESGVNGSAAPQSTPIKGLIY